MDKCVDSSHEGNGCPGAGIVFPAVEKLLSAVDALIDIDVGGVGPSGRALALVTRRQGELIDASAKCDAKVAFLRRQLASAEAERDALRAENAELRARAEAAEWRPIETAPKDGRAVLLHNNNAPGNPSGRMESCEGYNTVVGEWWASDQSDDDADGLGDWTCYMDAIEDPRCPFEPTHWMPLPAAPDQKGTT